MRALHHSVVSKRKLSKKAKLFLFKSIFIPILVYSHNFELWPKKRGQNTIVRNEILRKIKGLTMFDKFRNTAILESLNIKLLLLRIESSQLRWLVHVSRMHRNGFPSKRYVLKPVRKDRLDDHGQDGLVISRILVVTVRDIVLAKCILCW